MGPLARDAGVHQTSTPRALTNTTGRGQRNRPFVTVVRGNEKCCINGVGPRVAESGFGHIPGFPYTAPYDELALKPG